MYNESMEYIFILVVIALVIFNFTRKPESSSKKKPIESKNKTGNAYSFFQTLYPEEEKIIQQFSKALSNHEGMILIKESEAKYSRTTIENAFEKGMEVAKKMDDEKFYNLLLGAGSHIGSIYPDITVTKFQKAWDAMKEEKSQKNISALNEFIEHQEALQYTISYLEKHKN